MKGLAAAVFATAACAMGALAQDKSAAKETARIEFPHPAITEVLFAVPTKGGDASGEGVRDATGDEFVELMNPHDEAIELEGYALSDRNVGSDGAVHFVFPALTLPPGGMVVVFNGRRVTLPEPFGTGEAAPEGRNDAFGGAWVFTMGVTSEQIALSNGGDFILLSDPEGNPIDAVTWGAPTPAVPEETVRIAETPARVQGSVQRVDPQGKIGLHKLFDGRLFSPGEIPTPTRRR